MGSSLPDAKAPLSPTPPLANIEPPQTPQSPPSRIIIVNTLEKSLALDSFASTLSSFKAPTSVYTLPEPAAHTPASAPSTSSPPRHSLDSHHSALLACSSRKSRSSLRSGLETIVRKRARSGLGRLQVDAESKYRLSRWDTLIKTAVSICLSPEESKPNH
jgi:hypothetical protein